MKVKKVFIVFCLFFLQAVANAQNKFVVDADAVVRTVAGNYNAIKVSGGIDLYISQSDEMAVAISASTETMRNGIKTVIENGMLHIYYDGEKRLIKKNYKLRAYVSCIQLKKIEASGSCDVFIVDSLETSDITLHLSGASDFKGQLKAVSLDVILSGASDVYLSGTAGTVNINSSGASDIHAYKLVTDFCNINTSGASDVTITVNNELNVKATGASNVYYKGKGVLRKNESSNSCNIENKN